MNGDRSDQQSADDAFALPLGPQDGGGAASNSVLWVVVLAPVAVLFWAGIAWLCWNTLA